MTAGGRSADKQREFAARAERVRATVSLSSVIGRAVKLRKAGAEQTGLCPFHSDKRDGAFMVNDGKALFKCFACGATGDVIDFLQRHRGIEFIEALKALEADAGLAAMDFTDPAKIREAEEARARREAEQEAESDAKRKRGAAMWFGAAELAKTPAADYLAGRGIRLGQLGAWPSSLRYVPDAWCRELQERGEPREACKIPAMIAGVWRLDGVMLGCHRTYLDIGGLYADPRQPVRKAALTDAKLTLGPSLGGYIPLQKGESKKSLAQVPEGTDIYLSEGIEDGLSVALGKPEARVIAGVSLSKLGAVQLPPQMGALVMIAQRDPDDSAAAAAFERAIAAHQKQGRTVRLMWPPEGFKDFNDLLMGKRMMANNAA